MPITSGDGRIARRGGGLPGWMPSNQTFPSLLSAWSLRPEDAGSAAARNARSTAPRSRGPRDRESVHVAFPGGIGVAIRADNAEHQSARGDQLAYRDHEDQAQQPKAVGGLARDGRNRGRVENQGDGAENQHVCPEAAIRLRLAGSAQLGKVASSLRSS